MHRLVDIASRLTNSAWFEYFIIAVIIVNGIILGLETSGTVDRLYGEWLRMGNEVALWVFIVEAALKMLARWPRSWRYFRDGWNIFDFLVIVFALVPATGQFAMIARLARLLRVVRLISAIRDLRLIVAALVRAIPSVGHVIMLMSIVVYIYAIMGYHLFHQIDPARWGNLGLSVLTLFNIITLDNWTNVMDTAMRHYPWAWIYFVSFVVVGTFVVINMFIAIIINSLDDAKRERPPEIEGPVSREQLMQEIRAARATLERLEKRLEDGDDDGGKEK
ncbi:MAG: ion transporter [Chloroflexi bacterium]|nr:ion transporter [Chloroflexota bacterium]